MMTTIPQDDLELDAIRQEFELLPSDDLEDMATMRISFKNDCSPKAMSTFHQRQAVACEILLSRQVTSTKALN